MTTYKSRIEKIQSLKTWIITKLQTVPNVLKITGRRIDILNATELPLIAVNYMSGTQDDPHQSGNATATYEITTVAQVEDENDVMAICADIVALFEDNTLEGQVIGSQISLPENYYTNIEAGKIKVMAVIELNVYL